MFLLKQDKQVLAAHQLCDTLMNVHCRITRIYFVLKKNQFH